MSGYVWVDVSDAWHLAPRNVKPNSIFCKEHSKRGVKLYCSASHGKGKQWWVRCRTNPKEAAKSRGFYETDTEAQNVAAELRKELTKGSHADPDRGKITVSEWVDMWWKTKRAMDPHTRENYESYLRAHILPGLGHVSLDALLPLTVEQWLCGLPLEPSSARTVFSLLSAILEKAFVNDLMRRNPCKLIKLSELLGKGRRKRKVWSDERVTAVIRTVPERYKLAALVPAAAGLRQAEVFGLAVEDLDPDAGVIHVRRQLKLVGGKLYFGLLKAKGKHDDEDDLERDVPLHPELHRAIREHLHRYPPVRVTLPNEDPEGEPVTVSLILTNEKSQPVRRKTFNEKVWRVALELLGIIAPRKEGDRAPRAAREHGMHAVRHWWASVMLELGATIPQVAEWLGHRDEAFTLRTYLHATKRAGQRNRKDYDRELTALVAAVYGPATPGKQGAVPSPRNDRDGLTQEVCAA